VDIGVLVKASLDGNMIRADPDGRINIENTPLLISEYDRNAVVEAARIKSEVGGKIYVYTLLTWGPTEKKKKELENVVREALALGGDEAYAVVDDRVIPCDVTSTAYILSNLIRKFGNPELILAGEASMDMLSSQMPIRLARHLGYNVVTFARKIELSDNKIRVTRDLEDKLEVVETSLPAVISVTGEINRPKLPTLLQIRKAFAKPFKVVGLDELELEDTGRKISYSDLRLITITRKNVIIEADKLEDIADILIDKLIEEGVVRV